MQRLVVEVDHIKQRAIGAIELRQALDRFGTGRGEQRAVAPDQLLVAPARERLLLEHAHLDRVGPALAHFDALHPRQRRYCGTQVFELDRKEATAEMLRRCRADLFRADMIEFGRDRQIADRPALLREPAVEHAGDRQHDQRDGNHHQRAQQQELSGATAEEHVPRAHHQRNHQLGQ